MHYDLLLPFCWGLTCVRTRAHTGAMYSRWRYARDFDVYAGDGVGLHSKLLPSSCGAARFLLLLQLFRPQQV